ncbi:MAG TPA: hypothetical protein VIH52_04345 [Candidatus Nanoarchaeia archaeon]
MKFIPKLIPSSKKHKKFVVLEVGLGRVNIAIFEFTDDGPRFVGVGRRSFGATDTILDATLEATDALGAIVDELPRAAIVGVCGGRLAAVTTIAKYNRENTKKPVDKDELSSVLQKIAAQPKKDLKVFFSTVSGAKIDQAKVANPLGIKGEKAEISCFVAYKPPEELAVYDQVIEELEIKPLKIMPVGFAVSQMVATKLPSETLILRVGANQTEAAQLHEGHLVGITNFDVGGQELEFYNFAVEALLEKQDEKERSKAFWLYADSDNVDLVAVKKRIKEVDWAKKFNLSKEFEVTLAEGENNFGPADQGLLALSLQEVI